MLRSSVCFSVLIALFAVSVWAGDFPPGPMQEKVKNTCTSCHAASQVTKQHKTKAEWSKILDKMVGYGAEVSDADRPAILKYLATNFGPGKAGKSAKSDDNSKSEDNTK